MGGLRQQWATMPERDQTLEGFERTATASELNSETQGTQLFCTGAATLPLSFWEMPLATATLFLLSYVGPSSPFPLKALPTTCNREETSLLWIIGSHCRFLSREFQNGFCLPGACVDCLPSSQSALSHKCSGVEASEDHRAMEHLSSLL